MEVRITVSGIGAGIPALSMGVNIRSEEKSKEMQ